MRNIGSDLKYLESKLLFSLYLESYPMSKPKLLGAWENVTHAVYRAQPYCGVVLSASPPWSDVDGKVIAVS